MKFVRVEMDPKRRLLVFTPQARDGVDLHLLISDGGKHKKGKVLNFGCGEARRLLEVVKSGRYPVTLNKKNFSIRYDLAEKVRP
jgi:hypothetical protein